MTEQQETQPTPPTLSEEVRAMETHAPLPDAPTKFGGLPARTPSEIRQHRGFLIVLNGPPGVGKTTLAPTIRDSQLVGGHVGKRIALLDADAGSHVLDDFDDVDIFEAKTAQDVDNFTQQLIRNPEPYNGAIIDGGTEMLDLYKAKHSSRTGWDYWNNIYDDYLAVVRGMRNLARNRAFFCVIVLWDTGEKDDTGKVHWREINLTPKLGEKFLGLIDVLGYLEMPPKGLPPYPPILRFDPQTLGTQGSVPTKMRVNPRQQALTHLPSIVYQPNLGHIIDSVVGGKPWPEAQHQRRMP